MANINDMIFIIQFLGLIGIFLYQMFNLMHKGKIYDIRISFILLITLTIAWGTGLFVVLLETTKATYSILFMLESLFFVLSYLFFFFELLFFGVGMTKKIIKPFKSIESKNKFSRG